MKDNIKPEHYRKGEIDLYEAFSQIFPHNEYRAGMQMIAMRYMFRDKIDRVEDINKAIQTLERLKEKEIEHDDRYEEIPIKDGTVTFKDDNNQVMEDDLDILNDLRKNGYEYIVRDKNGELWAHPLFPYKFSNKWSSHDVIKQIEYDRFTEVKWTDDEPTKIADLLATYENGGENGK